MSVGSTRCLRYILVNRFDLARQMTRYGEREEKINKSKRLVNKQLLLFSRQFSFSFSLKFISLALPMIDSISAKFEPFDAKHISINNKTAFIKYVSMEKQKKKRRKAQKQIPQARNETTSALNKTHARGFSKTRSSWVECFKRERERKREKSTFQRNRMWICVEIISLCVSK